MIYKYGNIASVELPERITAVSGNNGLEVLHLGHPKSFIFRALDVQYIPTGPMHFVFCRLYPFSHQPPHKNGSVWTF